MRTITGLSFLSLGILLAPCADAELIVPSVVIGTPGTTERVNVDQTGQPADGISYNPAISPDGRFVAFSTENTYFFVRDRMTQVSQPIERFTIGYAHFSADGRFMAYSPGILTRIHVFDQLNGRTELIDNTENCCPTISATGRYIAYESDAAILPDDTNGSRDVYLHDRKNHTVERVSVNSTGRQGNGWSFTGAISADGMVVAFLSQASNLVAGDTNNEPDVYVHDRSTGRTERVSVATNGAGGPLASETSAQAIDAKGRRIVFTTWSKLVADDTNEEGDVYVHDRKTGVTRRVSIDTNGAQQESGIDILAPSISVNGRYVVFHSKASNLAPGKPGHNRDIFVHDLLTGVTTLASTHSDGSPADDDSYDPLINSDGRYVAFTSLAGNLVDNDTNGVEDIFVRTRHRLAYTGLAAVPDMDGNGAPEFATLRVLADGNLEVTVKDSVTRAQINVVSIPGTDWEVRGLTVLPDISGDGSPEVGVLFRRHDGQGIVQLRDLASGAEIQKLHFLGAPWEARAVTSFDANQDGVPDIGVIAVRDDLSEGVVQIRDAVNQVSLGTVRLPAAPGDAFAGVTILPDMNGNGAPEVAALRSRAGRHHKAIIKDSESGEHVKTVKFDAGNVLAGGIVAVRYGNVPAVAALFSDYRNERVIEVRNAVTGEFLQSIDVLGQDWDATAVSGLDSDGDGSTELGALGVRKDGSAVAVELRNAVTADLVHRVSFPADDR